MSILNRRRVRGVVGIAVTALGVISFIPSGPSAGADPRQLTSKLIGVGSDTTQDVVNALAGETNNIDYTPIHSDFATGRLQLTSWDAVPPSGSAVVCISPKAPGASFLRPNGSGNGRKALSRAIDGTNYGVGDTTCGTTAGKPISGLVDFARSSGLSTVTGTDLTFIPFGKDAVSYAYYTTGGATAITDLTAAELKSIYTVASPGAGLNITRGATTTHVIPCDIQAGSGTRSFFRGAIGGISDSQYDAATLTCHNGGTVGAIEENDPSKLKAKGDAIGGTNQFIIGMSVASFVAQSNGKAPSHLAAGVTLGAISNDDANTPANGTNIGAPFTGTAPNLTPSSTFYASPNFGRLVYNVFDSNRVQPGTTGNLGLKQIFVGASSLLCSSAAQATVNAFGFLSTSSCGDTSIQRGLE